MMYVSREFVFDPVVDMPTLRTAFKDEPLRTSKGQGVQMYIYNPNRKGLAEVKILGLETWRLYPPLEQLKVDFLKQNDGTNLRIEKGTPIASIGSCFAREIKTWLIDNGYNYVQTATGVCTESGSARYDRVFNTFSIRQEFERAFGAFEPVTKCWRLFENGKERLLEPYRYMLAWDSEDEMEAELIEHRDAVREAFTTAKVIIITVGQSEIWYDKRDDSVFPMVPPQEIFDPEIHGFRMSTYQENLDNLNRSYELLKAANPDAHVLITVSPVPLRATFRRVNSVIADTAGKSMLRAVVDEFVRNAGDDVTYFPAFEVVKVLAETPFKEDARHVRRDTVADIMSLFEAWFVEGGVELTNEQRLAEAVRSLEVGDHAQAATHLEAVLRSLQTHSADSAHPQESHRWFVYEQLGSIYLRNQRYAEAYELLHPVVEHTRQNSPGRAQLLTNVCALAMDCSDYQRVPSLLEQLLAHPSAPLTMFFHWVVLLQRNEGVDTARAALSDGLTSAPRLRNDPEFSEVARRVGLAG